MKTTELCGKKASFPVMEWLCILIVLVTGTPIGDIRPDICMLSIDYVFVCERDTHMHSLPCSTAWL